MKNPTLYSMATILLLTSCNKMVDQMIDKQLASSLSASSHTVDYVINQGQHDCNQNAYKIIETSQLKFVVRFDSSAIYQTASLENQYDINKLYGFSDNNADHHQFSARFGWRWSDGALRLFAYIYNNGVMSNKELGTVAIGIENNCSIQVTATTYVFTLNGQTTEMPRLSTTPKAKGYLLYPYFGGNETAPHNVHIWIKS